MVLSRVSLVHWTIAVYGGRLPPVESGASSHHDLHILVWTNNFILVRLTLRSLTCLHSIKMKCTKVGLLLLPCASKLGWCRDSNSLASTDFSRERLSMLICQNVGNCPAEKAKGASA